MNPAPSLPSVAGDSAPAHDRYGIEVADLGVRFGELEVIRDMRFSIRSGEFVSLIGPSGCGKSTLLRVLAGLIPASTGAVRVGGRAFDGKSDWVRMGLVFQKPLLLPWRTTLENVVLPIELELGGNVVREADLKRARRTLQLVRLADFENAYPFQLSGGMQQRAALARALLRDPEVLLMDEPFGALDELTRDALNDELLNIWRSSETRLKTVVMVTHSIVEAVALSDRVLVFAPRPARLLEAVEVRLPHPRQFGSVEFSQLVAHVRELIRRTT